jgi:hypothetical protein
MVRFTAPNGQQITSYDSKNDRVAELGEIWTDLTFWHKSEFWQNFTMTSPKTLYTKNAVNE